MTRVLYIRVCQKKEKEKSLQLLHYFTSKISFLSLTVQINQHFVYYIEQLKPFRNYDNFVQNTKKNMRDNSQHFMF